MTVEIKELVIRAVVVDEQEGKKDTEIPQSVVIEDKEAIVEECIRQILKILQKSKER